MAATDEAYVWVWLPGATEPVVAGRLEAAGDIAFFNYGASYLRRPEAIALYEPELPLRTGRIRPLAGLRVAGCLKDAGPDAWGQRVILARLTGRLTPESDTASLDLLTYLLESGSDRIGALDFQARHDVYTPRWSAANLSEMIQAAELLEAGETISPTLERALLHGSSVGGVRPKVLLDDGSRKLIAKLSSRTDPYPVVKAEGVAMELARRVGLHVARTEVIDSYGHDVLLVERFDRTSVPGERRALVSGLTMLGLDEMMSRYGTYVDLAEIIRGRFDNPRATLRELFNRIVFSICVGNIDDHPRNHAAFWDGEQLSLTPAYDICPQPRSGGEASQAMAFGTDGYRRSKLAGCVAAAAVFQLDSAEARGMVDHQVECISREWIEACDAARLTTVERQRLWQRQILNPFIFEDD